MICFKERVWEKQGLNAFRSVRSESVMTVANHVEISVGFGDALRIVDIVRRASVRSIWLPKGSNG